MKKLLLLSFFVSIGLFAQEAGKVGKKLENELNNEKLTPQKVNESRRKTADDTTINADQRRGNNPNADKATKHHPQYNWVDKYAYGYSEVFLRIPEKDLFSVTLDDQNITTPTGKYRFFDVIPGRNILQIYQRGRLVYQIRLTVPQNKRMILDFFTNEGLYLLESQNLYNQNNSNYYDTWNHTWNNYYNNNQNYDYNNWNPNYGVNENQNFNNPYNQNTQNYPNNPQNNYGGYNNYNTPRAMSSQDFAQFKSGVKQQSFEDTKLQMLKTQPQNIWFKSEQIKELMQLFSFDDNRLEVAKFGFDRCVDPQNFYITYSALTFDESKNHLMQYVASRSKK